MDKRPARSKDTLRMELASGEDSPKQKSEKRTLFASQKEVSESLRYLASKESTSEDSVTQEETVELLDLCV